MRAIQDPTILVQLQIVYESGEVSCRKICKDFKIANSTLRSYINKSGWSRKKPGGEVITYAKQSVILSEQNKTKLVESGGDELYRATEDYFKCAAEVQSQSYYNLMQHKTLVEETVELAEEVGDDTKAVLNLYLIQNAKMEFLINSQKFIETNVNSITKTMKGTRESLGLSDNNKDKAGDLNINILIADGLRKGRERIEQIKPDLKNISKLVMPAELIE